MRNLSRALALAAALVLTVLTGQASAETIRNCFVKCEGAAASSYTFGTTYANCCTWDVENHCPAGSTPIPMSWNSMRCVF